MRNLARALPPGPGSAVKDDPVPAMVTASTAAATVRSGRRESHPMILNPAPCCIVSLSGEGPSAFRERVAIAIATQSQLQIEL
jgi:hypothetical protein